MQFKNRRETGIVLADVLLKAWKGQKSLDDYSFKFLDLRDLRVVQASKSNRTFLEHKIHTHEVKIESDEIELAAELAYPEKCKGWIIFSHGSGSTKNSPRNIQIARSLNQIGFGTLLFDLLTEEESKSRDHVFDIELLAWRLSIATRWLRSRMEWKNLPIGYFGASTGAAAALQACAFFEANIFAIVSRGGRPDLARGLEKIRCPVLLLVGGQDHEVLELNETAATHIGHCIIKVVLGAGHLFEEPGTLDQVSHFSRAWFEHLVDRQDHKPLPPKPFSAHRE